MADTRLRTFIMDVEDLPGVLNRVTSLFRRRGYNIESLAVGRTEVPGVSRITIIMEASDDAVRRIEANLYKLVNVLRVEDMTYRPAVQRELALIKVRADNTTRAHILQLADVFRARTIDVGPEALIFELTGTADKIDGLADVLAPYGVVEMIRTGSVAMLRSAGSAEATPTQQEEPRTNAA